MQYDYSTPDQVYEKMLADSGITREKFDGYKNPSAYFEAAEVDIIFGPWYAISAGGRKLVSAGDTLYKHRETAEIIAKLKNLWIKPPRERGVYQSSHAAAAKWAKLTGRYEGNSGGWIYARYSDGSRSRNAVYQGWHGLARKLEREGRIEPAGFGRSRITADELARIREAVPS